MIHVTRAEWNARLPDSTTPLNRGSVNKFIVHYSGASRSQTVRSIQDFCMDTKDHIDIDYNRIVHGQYDYMGRGWSVGGHTRNNNSTSYGVCVIGQDGDATDDDMRTVRGIYEEVCATLGRRITMTTHRGVLGASYTDCPGLELHNWVMAGMPYPSGGNVTSPISEQNFNVLIGRVEALALQLEHAAIGQVGEPIKFIQSFNQLLADVKSILTTLSAGVTVPTAVNLSAEALNAVELRVRLVVGDALRGATNEVGP